VLRYIHLVNDRVAPDELARRLEQLLGPTSKKAYAQAQSGRRRNVSQRIVEWGRGGVMDGADKHALRRVWRTHVIFLALFVVVVFCVPAWFPERTVVFISLGGVVVALVALVVLAWATMKKSGRG
jgi:hypothetical protein